MFQSDPGQLAKSAREGTEWLSKVETQLEGEDIGSLYKELWGTRPTIVQPFTKELESGGKALELETLMPAISTQEIYKRIKRMRKGTASGPDGIKKAHITSRTTVEILRLYYSLLLVSKAQPTEWRQNRTRLVLKEGKDSQRAENYRPITIGSLLSRLYWGLMDERLRSEVRLTPRQKGFVNEDGCFNNVHTLNEILKLAKKGDGITIVQLDISKAFDTVPHEVIGDALRRKGIPETVVRLIRDSYNDMSTVIKQGAVEVPINLQRGVKQGDPLSPMIFNIIMEPLLIKLESMEGYLVGGQTVSSLAFADDLILLARREEQAITMLSVVEQYLEGLGMKLSAPKCAAVTIKVTKDSWFLTDPELQLSKGDSIPVANADTMIKYLGGQISP
jgi:hypothetical protein